MNIILTGTTGTLGSQILYELLQHEGVEDICLLIRDKTDKTALSRLLEVLKCDNAPSAVSGHVDEHLKKIQVINQHNFFSPERFLLKGKGYCFIHSASIVNLSTNPARREKILNENLGFTKKLFSAFSGYISKFTYISTAFCIGDVGGTIDNDYHAPDKTPNYRNFYEESKYLTEKYVLEQGRTLGIPVQILRPSVLGGNIYEENKYFVSKYMVYYLAGKFFNINPLKESNSFRMTVNFESGLNIIPVDYTAKVIVAALDKDIEQMNIANSENTDIVKGATRILNAVDYDDVTFIDTKGNGVVLEDRNMLEDLYYTKYGVHLNKYLTSKPCEFDTSLQESVMPIPDYDRLGYVEDTIKYARANNFEDMTW